MSTAATIPLSHILLLIPPDPHDRNDGSPFLAQTVSSRFFVPLNSLILTQA